MPTPGSGRACETPCYHAAAPPRTAHGRRRRPRIHRACTCRRHRRADAGPRPVPPPPDGPAREPEPPRVIELAVVLALIALNGFFALSEMALMTSRKLRLKQLAEHPVHPSRGARKALVLAEHPDNLLSTVQVGITAIGVLAGSFGGEAIGLAIAGWVQGV